VIHRGPTHEIEDYKTGALYEADPTGATAVKSHYRVQMLLYAALEHAATGSWPTRATLIPLQGPPALIAIDPDEAAHVAEMSMDALDTYNAAVEADADFQTLASPSAETCVYCPYAIRCPAFWNAASENWRDAGIVAVSGEITHRTESRLSTFNATIAATHGSLPKGEYVLVQLESDRFRELADAPLDSHCAAVGLRSDTVTRQLRSTSRTVTCTA
jgi:hypothetical protein